MKTPLILLSFAAAVAAIASPPEQRAGRAPAAQAAPVPVAAAQADQNQQQAIPNERMDYDKFLKTAREVRAVRETRRITEERFMQMAAEQGTVVLDARSADKYQMRHIKGAISLPFTDFTEASLAKVIPEKTTRVLIYCNNNFRGSPRAFADKRAGAALNMSTYVSLATYGYTNIWELGPLLDVSNTKIVFEGAEVAK